MSFLDPPSEPDPESRGATESAADGDVLELLYSLTLGSTGQRIRRSELASLKLQGVDSARCNSATVMELACVRGLYQGMIGAAAGDVRKIVLRPPMGYGVSGFRDEIGPNETLIFQVEVRDVTAM